MSVIFKNDLKITKIISSNILAAQFNSIAEFTVYSTIDCGMMSPKLMSHYYYYFEKITPDFIKRIRTK
ncbi:hypothetical protein BpHYR1_029319 [Brachionus plicatilis]|uniref:Uncharacterized protein n=1 Tax=Brachionus plicatilis TaxID=10195 RepID=A0A3M7PFV7_BRAPC|nr:hypothetical protein BpHYR1_029319 [Brachionus plicatilis]